MTTERRVVDVPFDDSLRAIVTEVRELRYARPPAADLDVPPIVRAASAVRSWRGRWAIVQDDVRALALADDDGCADLVALPASPDGRRSFDDLRGNKAAKPDFEAAVVLPDGRLLAFGSGAKPVRELLVVANSPEAVHVRAAHEFYAVLRAALAGATPNVEGALVTERSLLMFQRGTALVRSSSPSPSPTRSTASATVAVDDHAIAGPRGDVTATAVPLNAILEWPLDAFLAWLDGDGPVPAISRITAYRLGFVGGAALGFTDAAHAPDERIAFLACAEATSDATKDGAILAARFGVISRSDDARQGVARQGRIVDGNGRDSLLKLEGLEPVPGEPRAYVAVTDADDPSAPALLIRLEVRDDA